MFEELFYSYTAKFYDEEIFSFSFEEENNSVLNSGLFTIDTNRYGQGSKTSKARNITKNFKLKKFISSILVDSGGCLSTILIPNPIIAAIICISAFVHIRAEYTDNATIPLSVEEGQIVYILYSMTNASGNSEFFRKHPDDHADIHSIHRNYNSLRKDLGYSSKSVNEVLETLESLAYLECVSKKDEGWEIVEKVTFAKK